MNKKLLLSFALAAAMAGCINDADVPSGNGDNPISGAKGGNMEISFVVPNSSNGSRAASAEDSGVYEDGTAEEYKVSNVKLYLFDSSSKNLVTTLDVDQNELGISSKENSQEGQTIIYSCNKEIILEPGNYDILAVANGTQNLDIEKEIGQESTLLGQIDATTYGNGMITSVPGKGFIMSNRGSANLNIAVESPEKSDTRAHVRINLERAVAKLMVRNDSKGWRLRVNNKICKGNEKDSKSSVYIAGGYGSCGRTLHAYPMAFRSDRGHHLSRLPTYHSSVDSL